MNRIERYHLFDDAVRRNLNIDVNSLLPENENRAIINMDCVHDIIMNKVRKAVDKVHKYKIYQGSNSLWASMTLDKATGKRGKIVGHSEEEVYQKLYVYYFGEYEMKRRKSLKDMYEEWFAYKCTTLNRMNTAKRIDQDYLRYYVNEPLSKTILTTPLANLKKADIEIWAHALIKKYDMTHKAFSNCALILKEVLEYMYDQELIQDNVYTRVRINKAIFRHPRKKPANTQIFFREELDEICRMAYKLAEETQDETFLAIPLLKLSGLRISECLGLAFEDFDKPCHLLHVHQSLVVVDERQQDGSWATRRYEVQEYLKQNAQPRDVLVADECFDIADKVQSILNKKGIRRSYLFSVSTPNKVQMKLYRICDKLGIKRRSVHKLRKTYISNLMNNRVDADFVRTQVGHQDLQTTLNCYTFSTTKTEDCLAILNKIS